MSQASPAPPSSFVQLQLGWLARIAFGGLAAIGLVVLCGLWRLVAKVPATELAGLLERHGAALIGIPAASALALFLIGIIRAIDGPIAAEQMSLAGPGKPGS